MTFSIEIRAAQQHHVQSLPMATYASHGREVNHVDASLVWQYMGKSQMYLILFSFPAESM